MGDVFLARIITTLMTAGHYLFDRYGNNDLL